MAQRNDYTASAAQTVFTYTFQIFDTDEIEVYVNNVLQTLTTNYTVSNNALPLVGGTITLVTPSTAGDAIALVQNIPVERDIEYQTDGDFKAVTVNTDFDKIYTLLKQNGLDSQLSDRLIRFNNSIDRSSNTNQIPIPVAGNALIWGVTGDLENAPLTISDIDAPILTSAAQVQALDVSTTTNCFMLGAVSILDGYQNQLYYNAASTATPNAQTVIKPDSVTLPDPGRWEVITTPNAGMAADSVGTSNIIDANVTTSKIADSNITEEK